MSALPKFPLACCFLVAGSLLFTPDAFAKDQVPDWVRQAAAVKTPDNAKNADAVFLMEETTYSVAPDGGLVEHKREVIRVLRPQGASMARCMRASTPATS